MAKDKVGKVNMIILCRVLWVNLRLETVGKPCMILKKKDINRDMYFKKIFL